MAAVSSSGGTEDRKHSMANTARYSLPVGYNGSNGSGPRNGATPTPLPHVDDLVAIPDIDPNLSIKRLLEMAESSLRTAEMTRDFGSPAHALREYIKASIIAVSTISRHNDYPQLRDSWADLGAAHNRLLKRISEQNESFVKIKQDIVADNKRTGMQPTVQGSHSRDSTSRPESPARRPPATRPQTEGSHAQVNGSLGRGKPPVQPKPQSLHGNAIKPGHGRAMSVGQGQADLLHRFANLRGPQSSPGQDARIKTHPITMPPPAPRPAGPRDMPLPAKPKLGLDTISSLPKAPEAVYSPARGTAPGDTARQPMTTPRGTFARTTSSASIASTLNNSSQPQNNDYFFSTNGRSSYAGSSRPSEDSIPEGGIVTAEELSQAMKKFGSELLLIDIRDRDDFDEGHIFHSTILCIEPSILMRDGLSAEDISESLVISPSGEQELFETREKFELVVFYDQDSPKVPQSPRNSDDMALQSFHRALTTFNYGPHVLKNPIKILQGGLDAWVDLMGAANLKSTSAGAAGHPRRLGAQRRRSKYVKSLKPDEVETWKETLARENMNTASSPSFVRDYDDVLRRFPSISSSEMESMSSREPNYGSSHKHDLNSELPTPPEPPRRAVPRPSQRSQSNTPGDADFEQAPPPKALTRTRTMDEPLTGLHNPHNWCYANSTLQSLLMSPEFGSELANKFALSKYTVPRKPGEVIDQPQLMTRIITNLFHWMSSRKFQVMKAKTLMDYSSHLRKGQAIQFGDNKQQDAAEFLGFLFDNISDETNIMRDQIGHPDQPKHSSGQPLVSTAEQFWANYTRKNNSLIDNHWRGLQVSMVVCQSCRNATYRFSPLVTLFLPLHIGESRLELQDALRSSIRPSQIDDFECLSCKRRTIASQTMTFARMPPLLCIQLSRFHLLSGEKNQRTVTWNLNHFDFSEYFFPTDQQRAHAKDSTHRAFRPPFHYECYAVILHRGLSTNSGHYRAFVRDPKSSHSHAWLHCNDSEVTKVRMDAEGTEKFLWSGKMGDPYLLFFRRKDTGSTSSAGRWQE